MRFIVNSKSKYARTLASTVVVVLCASAAALQSPVPNQKDDQASDTKYASFVYDVATIKPNKGDDTSGVRIAPDGLQAKNISLRSFVAVAYGMDNASLHGAPDWLNRDKFDIDAKMDPTVADAYHKLSRDEQGDAFRHMVRVLLEDRLNLKVHMETKDGQVYALVIAKDGIKFHRTADATATGGNVKSGASEDGAELITAHSARIEALVNTLTDRMRAPVVDQTGLTGLYDFTLKFASPRMVAAAQSGVDSIPLPETAPELTVAIQEQLGLKLEQAKGPIKIAVIDHVEKPSAN
jgi:uncharacterized protein (TIGR03435 family)